jgi:hypothetical protein
MTMGIFDVASLAARAAGVPQVLPLAVELGGEEADPGRIATRIGQRTYEDLAVDILGATEDRDRRRCLLRGANGGSPPTKDDIDLGHDQFCRMLRDLVGSEPMDLPVLILDETAPAQRVTQRGRTERITWHGIQGADAIGPSRLLSAYRHLPAEDRTAEQRDNVAPVHYSMISSARTSNRIRSEAPMSGMVPRTEGARRSKSDKLL